MSSLFVASTADGDKIFFKKIESIIAQLKFCSHISFLNNIPLSIRVQNYIFVFLYKRKMEEFFCIFCI